VLAYLLVGPIGPRLTDDRELLKEKLKQQLQVLRSKRKADEAGNDDTENPQKRRKTSTGKQQTPANKVCSYRCIDPINQVTKSTGSIHTHAHTRTRALSDMFGAISATKQSVLQSKQPSHTSYIMDTLIAMPMNITKALVRRPTQRPRLQRSFNKLSPSHLLPQPKHM
jgi:hypothetical protein